MCFQLKNDITTNSFKSYCIRKRFPTDHSEQINKPELLDVPILIGPFVRNNEKSGKGITELAVEKFESFVRIVPCDSVHELASRIA